MISLADQIAEAKRELALRKRCYPQWVQSGRLDATKAQHQLVCMEAIVDTLERVLMNQSQMSLFMTGM